MRKPKRKTTKIRKSYKVCAVAKCRKKVMDGSDRCRIHFEEILPVHNATDDSTGESADQKAESVAVTEQELLKYRALTAEIQAELQIMQISNFQMKELQTDFQNKTRSLESQRQAAEAKAKRINVEYKPFVEALAEKYGVDDAQHMIIDTKTGIVRDGSKT